MARTNNLSNYLEDVATAIKTKKGDNSPINASNFDTEIENLPSDGDISEYFTDNYPTYGNVERPVVIYVLKKIPKISFNGTSLLNFFQHCTYLKEVDLSLFQTSNVTTMKSLFYYCESLKELNLGNFDATKCANVQYMFSGCKKLENLIFMHNLGKGFTVQGNNYSYYELYFINDNMLTHESLMDIINKVYDLNLTYGSTLYTQKLVLGDTNLAKLTAEEIAIATNKGWTVS